MGAWHKEERVTQEKANNTSASRKRKHNEPKEIGSRIQHCVDDIS
jgi:hypothetical protein